MAIGHPRWYSGKESACQCRRCKKHKFDPWVGKICGGGNGNPPQYSCNCSCEGLPASSKQGLPSHQGLLILKCVLTRVANRGQQASHNSLSLGRKENAAGSMDGAFPLLTGNELEELVSFCTTHPAPFGPQCLEGYPILVLGSSPPRPLKHCQECSGGGCRPAIGLRPEV